MHKFAVEDVVADKDEEYTFKELKKDSHADIDWDVPWSETELNDDLWKSEGKIGVKAEDGLIAYSHAVWAVDLPCRDQTSADEYQDRAAVNVLYISFKLCR